MVAYGTAQSPLFRNRNAERLSDDGRRSSDQDLERRVRNYLLLRHIDGLESLRFTVVNGNVLLRGVVSSPTTKWRICEGCRHVAGVLNVIDRLIVAPGLQAPLAATSNGV